MKTAVCDCRIPRAALDTLKKYCDNVILLPPFERLQSEVASHPDMLLFIAENERTVFTHSEYSGTLCDLLAGCDYKIEMIPEKADKKYPFDVLLNAAVCGGCFFGRLDSVSSSLLDIADRNALKKINVKQGYCKCSSVVLHNAMITADSGISEAARREGIDVLTVSDGGVALDGYNKGFIGGASGSDGEKVYFCGDVSKHPNGEEIIAFCKKHGFEVISLSHKPLYDVGTIFFI